jgi:hypothetical protein
MRHEWLEVSICIKKQFDPITNFIVLGVTSVVKQ